MKAVIPAAIGTYEIGTGSLVCGPEKGKGHFKDGKLNTEM